MRIYLFYQNTFIDKENGIRGNSGQHICMIFRWKSDRGEVTDCVQKMCCGWLQGTCWWESAMLQTVAPGTVEDGWTPRMKIGRFRGSPYISQSALLHPELADVQGWIQHTRTNVPLSVEWYLLTAQRKDFLAWPHTSGQLKVKVTSLQGWSPTEFQSAL